MIPTLQLGQWGRVGVRGGTPPPAVLASAVSSGNSSTPSVSMPSGISAGHLLLAIVQVDARGAAMLPQNQGNGWVRIKAYELLTTETGVLQFVFAKVAVGSDTLSLAADASVDWAAVVHRFAAGAAQVESSLATLYASSSTSFDPPSLSPNPGAYDYLAIAAAGFDRQSQAFSAFPGGYATTHETYTGSASNTTSTGTAMANVSGSSINPGAFTIASGRLGHASTLAVYVPPASLSSPTWGSAGKTGVSFTSSLSVTMPGSIAAGDYLLCVVMVQGTASVAIDTGASGSDWTILPMAQGWGSTRRRYLIAKESASGSDALTLTLGSSVNVGAATFRIPGGSSKRMNVVTATSFGGSTTRTAPAIAPLPLSREYMVIALLCTYEYKTISAYPFGYTGDVNHTAGSNSQVAYAYKTETASSFAAADFTLGASGEGITDHIVLWGPYA